MIKNLCTYSKLSIFGFFYCNYAIGQRYQSEALYDSWEYGSSSSFFESIIPVAIAFGIFAGGIWLLERFAHGRLGAGFAYTWIIVGLPVSMLIVVNFLLYLVILAAVFGGIFFYVTFVESDNVKPGPAKVADGKAPVGQDKSPTKKVENNNSPSKTIESKVDPKKPKTLSKKSMLITIGRMS